MANSETVSLRRVLVEMGQGGEMVSSAVGIPLAEDDIALHLLRADMADMAASCGRHECGPSSTKDGPNPKDCGVLNLSRAKTQK